MVHHVDAISGNLLNLKGIGPEALRSYITSASETITLLTDKPCSHLDPTTLANKRPKTLPMLGEILCQRRGAWKALLPRKEPFTLAMIDALSDFLQTQT